MGMKVLHGFYAFFSFCLLLSSIIAIVFSQVWHKKSLLLNMVFSDADLTAGLVLGIALGVTWLLSVFAIVQRNHVTIGLVALNWCLILDSIAITVVGTFVWFYTLRQRAEFHTVWAGLPESSRITLQDQFSCCGYFNASDLIAIGGNFCTSQEKADQLNTTVLKNFCVTPITAYSDVSLNDVFTSVYGFMAVAICLFMTSLCVIKVRQEIERFKRIDSKRGGRGFV
ncbi:hypothetical protein HETIRDRAFT_407613 [Heterobasidion irregulare TC 32-1]|uniref:Tetraspanin n=1 Tax=Heterobasidion irregulare (strain TC 32-1) TaxID=747525 RepID=W4KII7_HETIT|nr:uncharacterized protein HETIRDRAFT_407613 [Heterobasidion irregulare TC 32-1]ETW85673.1 hypothetical protein HETIRDRAFT_407613 [Heterobasidion irregulare TC 32-1]